MVRVESPIPLSEWLRQYGRMPLPPYLKRHRLTRIENGTKPCSRSMRAPLRRRLPGSISHRSLLARLQQRRIGLTTVTLHVGVGTFKPVTVRSDRRPSDGRRMDRSRSRDGSCHRAGASRPEGRIVAVGTTVVRALETAARADGQIRPYRGETDMFMTPGFPFQGGRCPPHEFSLAADHIADAGLRIGRDRISSTGLCRGGSRAVPLLQLW